MKLKLSSRKRIPLLVDWGDEYYPWEWLKLTFDVMNFRKVLREERKLHLQFSYNVQKCIHHEWAAWKKCYTPSIHGLTPYSLILDAGSGEGETVLFYYLLGYRNFRCVELNETCCKRLKKNTAHLTGGRFDIRCRAFQPEDVLGVDFAKVDVEGGEIELLKIPIQEMPNEICLETHGSMIEQELQEHLNGLQHEMTWTDNPRAAMWRWIKSGETRNGTRTYQQT
jgi:SAM-dependent methyltransferase